MSRLDRAARGETRRPLRPARVAFVVALIVLAPPPSARAQEEAPLDPVGATEPPPEAAEGEDYAIALADSLDEDSVEIGVGASGRPGFAPRRTRRIRFRGEGLNAAVREGAGDPLAGGAIEGGFARGTLRAGRLAPRWGRGIVLGAPADPWDARTADRGVGGGRAGDGVQFRRGERSGFETLAGTFERRRISGAHLFHGPFSVSGIADGRRRGQTSLGFGAGRDEIEVALDDRGRWRADALRARDAAGGTIEAQARFGSTAFRSLAEPLRSGPAQAITLRFTGSPGTHALGAIGSWWRFRPGRAGARAALLYAGDLPSGRAVLAFEEQHGPRREGLAPRATRGVRQGVWGEWTSRQGAITASLRHEVWGGQRLRDAVRRVSGVRVEIAGPGSARIRVAQTAFRVGFGESLYLREAYSDRLVLRALSGNGQRTHIECRVPAAGGRLTVSMQLTRTRGDPARMVWSLDWARIARTRR
jgi:hypothetical protein